MHTRYTDGRGSVAQLVEEAAAKGLASIAVTEHVRRRLSYDFRALVDDIREARKASAVEIFVGCEAKVLNEQGDLDAGEETLRQCDLVLAAFHSYPGDGDSYLKAVIGMLNNPAVHIWAHPFRSALRGGILAGEDELDRIFAQMRRNGKIFEINARFPPDARLVARINRFEVEYCFGSDSHHAGELLTAGFQAEWRSRLWR